jgi:hypothetical protein
MHYSLRGQAWDGSSNASPFAGQGLMHHLDETVYFFSNALLREGGGILFSDALQVRDGGVDEV